jgi:plastocyanin
VCAVVRRGTAVFGVLGFTLLGAPPASAGALPTPVVVATDSKSFLPSEVTIVRGASLEFANLDPLAAHDLTDSQHVPPWFGTGAVASAEHAPVAGVETLDPRGYLFICTRHGATGTLEIIDLE